MNEHEKTVRAARQVEVMMGFYIHFVVFVLVCVGLVAVNWLTTPKVWWAQWPFLGWGVGVLLHGLCAFGGTPNAMARWRLQKIRELTDPARPARTESGGSSAARRVGLLVLGLLIGCAAAGGYVYSLLRDAQQQAQRLEAWRDALERSTKERDAQLRQLSAEKSSLENTMKGTKEQLDQIQAAKQAAEQALKETRDRLEEAEAARAAAERALAEARKGTHQ